jgi:hypothetical protein
MSNAMITTINGPPTNRLRRVGCIPHTTPQCCRQKCCKRRAKHCDKGATYAVAPQLHDTPQPLSQASRIAPYQVTPTE